MNVKIVLTKKLCEIYIYPHLTYCVEIWGNACNIHLDPIFKVKKPVLKSLNMLCFHKLVIQCHIYVEGKYLFLA